MWNDFEHRIWKKVKSYELNQKKLFITVSGGLDSMALLNVFLNLKLTNIQVLHFHHGDFENMEYRNQSLELVQNYCRDNNMPFEFQKANEPLHSESDFRQARTDFFKLFKSKEAVMVTGHHLDDVLETRLIKMIRGSGVESLKAFTEFNGETFRPFLDIPKKEILKYAIEKKMTWVEDPSNLQPDYLRNWIRNQWLPALNQKHVGGVENLAKSLDRILESENHFHTENRAEISYHGNEVHIHRLWFFSLSTKDQLKILSLVLRYFKKIEFSQGHLEEINKRLDKNQKEHTFEILGVNWVLNAQQIVIAFKG